MRLHPWGGVLVVGGFERHRRLLHRRAMPDALGLTHVAAYVRAMLPTSRRSLISRIMTSMERLMIDTGWTSAESSVSINSAWHGSGLPATRSPTRRLRN